eukprot:scaffold233_cov51-Phaeocystis_antarctica.AAC.2
MLRCRRAVAAASQHAHGCRGKPVAGERARAARARFVHCGAADPVRRPGGSWWRLARPASLRAPRRKHGARCQSGRVAPPAARATSATSAPTGAGPTRRLELRSVTRIPQLCPLFPSFDRSVSAARTLPLSLISRCLRSAKAGAAG